ncbi:phosphatidylserine/phosphatidylglycerophosphate/cardiolipin synthase family protein [Arthrobacter sp. U41]|uniref:phospholipase D-like domain-containing protein n=1 Tax=Arthrobacter sp. U41 TaxID=1849032 RepID=UPI001C92C74E|nr:phospholipase D-like domain-containing protein [Arthrobacter sp. U41]
MPKTTHKALAASLMAGLLAVSAGTAAQAQAPGALKDAAPCLNAPATPVITGAAFNNPAAGRATGVVEQICNLVNQAAPGSKIQIANFVISGTAGMDFADTLLAAHSRGVAVQIVIDGWQIDKPAAAKLINELGVDETASSWVHVCSNKSPEGNTSSCIGTKGQHNKFYLFSETGGEQDVVVQSSANFTDVNSKTYWNNALTITDNHKLYEGYAGYFNDLVAEIQQPDYYRTVTAGMRGGKVTAHFFPSATVDPIVDRLSQLGCKNTGNTEIRIGMSEWDETRDGIADRLVEMAQAGCTVRIVHGPMAEPILQRFTAQPGIELRELDSSALPGRIHSKYLIVENATGKNSGRNLVMTGSHNYNATSLHRNDEAIVETSDRDVYLQYRDNFEEMWTVAQ